jgi:hypothetical protein
MSESSKRLRSILQFLDTSNNGWLAAKSHMDDGLYTMSRLGDMLHTMIGSHIPHGWDVAHHAQQPYSTWMTCCTPCLESISHIDDMLHTIAGNYIPHGWHVHTMLGNHILHRWHVAHHAWQPYPIWITCCTTCLAAISNMDLMLHTMIGNHIPHGWHVANHIPHGWHVAHHAW